MDTEQREQVGRVWSAGRYEDLAGLLEPASSRLARSVASTDPGQAIDVAAGTGSLAVALARTGWRTSAVDVAPRLVEVGRSRTASLGLAIDWGIGVLDDLPAGDASVDLVGSSFGLIFAPVPEAALREAHRVLRPGGRLALTVWPVDGFMATMSAAMGEFLPPGAPVLAPFRWGDRDELDRLLQPRFEEVQVEPDVLRWDFGTPADAVEFLFTASPGHVAAEAAAGSRAPELRAAVEQHLVEAVGPEASSIDLDFWVATARAR